MRPRTAAASLTLVALVSATLPGALADPAPFTPETFRPVPDPTTVMGLPALRPLVERGEVGLIKMGEAGGFRHITVAAMIDAPPTAVAEALTHPGEYRDFVPNVSRSDVELLSRDGRDLEITYQAEFPVISVKGTFRARIERDRMEMWGVRGDLVGGHILWRWQPDATGTRTLLGYSAWTDPRPVHWLLRKLSDKDPALEAAVNVAGGIVLIHAIRARAMALSGKPLPKSGTRRPGSIRSILAGTGKVDYRALLPFLEDGPIALVESTPDGTLVQGAMMTVFDAPRERVFETVSAPERYPDYVPHVDTVAITSSDATGSLLDWVYSTPILKVRFAGRFRSWAPSRTHMVAAGGDIKAGAWGWELKPLPPDRTLAVYYDSASLRDAGFILRKLIDSDRSFEHGLSVALGISMVRAVKGRIRAGL